LKANDKLGTRRAIQSLSAPDGTRSPNRKVFTNRFKSVCEQIVHDTASTCRPREKITSLQINEAQKNPDGKVRPGFSKTPEGMTYSLPVKGKANS
jgi:hypothetical protein